MRSGPGRATSVRISDLRNTVVFWLMIIFGAFGLLAPRNNLSIIAVILCAVSLSSAVLVILDQPPVWRFFAVSSEDMREALVTILAPSTTSPTP